ncbi:unnamed protein product [Rotaria magnacalcarata]|uniref:Uncharacterized protein n=3 Tax=Rotaria magnacalcarata TaxID=392030 RepID=A0A815XRE9_9BILA|nr:unnamed protein product [Rotaria magnacalcarata]CAF2052694.1 unnamed protein product [Rotaria magnacalcarata]CAF4225545.1 unnamed protein product [Rotaria magnacalcarata]CAF4275480.1 unnamed protein product [Rotaria magnacalcarata]
MSPIVKVPQHRSSLIRIPMSDPDGDPVRCRWGTNAVECGSVCAMKGKLQTFPCELNYTAGNTEGYDAIAIIIEDLDETNSPMSYVGLQFLIQVVKDLAECGIIPVYIGDRSPDECVALHSNEHIRERIIFQVGCTGMTITNVFADNQLPGLTKDPVMRDPENPYQFITYLNWTASVSGVHLLCVTAIDSVNQSSIPACWSYQVGTQGPEFLVDTNNPPIGQHIISSQRLWHIDASKPIIRPKKHQAFIRFVRRIDRHEVERINVGTSINATQYRGHRLTFFSTHKWNQVESSFLILYPQPILTVETRTLSHCFVGVLEFCQ